MANLKIIVIEGTDGSGKNIQSQKLVENLKSHNKTTQSLSFPNYKSKSSGPVVMYLGGELCENAKDFDAYQSSVLFMVDRLCSLSQLKNDLKNITGDVFLVFDRYVESNLIHQASKLNSVELKNQFSEWLYKTEYGLLKLPKPDMVIFLDMPIEKSVMLANSRKELKAGTKKDIHEQDFDYLKKSYETGLYFANTYNWDIINCVNNGKIRSIENISKEIFNLVKNKFNI